MSLRKGIVAAEEAKMARLIAEGASYKDVAEHLSDVDHDYVKKHIFEPMVAAHEKKKAAEALKAKAPAPQSK